MSIDGSMVLSNETNSGVKEKPFDPRKKTKDNEVVQRVWSSESVAIAEESLRKGFELNETPYNKRIKDYNLRAANLPFYRTDEEIQIFEALMDDKILFGNTVMHLKDAERGWTKITLRDYQEKTLNRYTMYNQNILMFPRQAGKTTTTVVEIVHFCCFNYEKDVVIIAQSDNVVNEILGKIKSAFSRLPFFMQPGFVKFTNDGFVLDNGCKCKIGVASESVVQGFSLDFLFIDEFAYISDSRARKFWINVYPALKNNPKSKCIIASTPNGRNLFWELWQAAVNGDNNFKANRIYWHEVPRRNEDGTPKNLEDFKRETIADIGLEGWLMGYECSFDTQLKALFSTAKQQVIRDNQNKYENKWSEKNDSAGTTYGMRFIDKSIIDYDLSKDYFIMGIDIGEGLQQDDSVIKLRKISLEDGEIRYRLVGIYQNNEIAVDDFAKLVMDFSKEFDKKKIQLAVENNNYGGEFFNQIINLKSYDKKYKWFDYNVIAKFRRESKDDYEYGYRVDQKRKKTAVSLWKRMITDDEFDDFDTKSIEQLMSFGRNKNGTYAAQYGHDDLVMADIAIAFMIHSNDLFNKGFLKKAHLALRIEACDYTNDEVVKHFEELEKEARKNKPKFSTPEGYTVRNSVEQLNKSKTNKRRFKKQNQDEDDDFLESRGVKRRGYKPNSSNINYNRTFK